MQKGYIIGVATNRALSVAHCAILKKKKKKVVRKGKVDPQGKPNVPIDLSTSRPAELPRSVLGSSPTATTTWSTVSTSPVLNVTSTLRKHFTFLRV